MELTHWMQGWRLWSQRSYAEAVDTRTGDRLLTKLRHRGRGVQYDRFGPNVGQPIQRPPIHPMHRDLPEMASGLRLGCWALDGCYELEIERPEIHARIILADSRSLACGPSDDPTMRQGVLLCHVECLRLESNVELSFRPVGGGEAPLQKILLDGPSTIQGGEILIAPGRSAFAVGRMPEKINNAKAFKRIRQMVSYVEHFGRDQTHGPYRMGHAVRWNVCYDWTRKEVYLAVSRSWVQMMASILGLPDCAKGPLLFGWDSALSALLVARSEPALARAIVRSLLARQEEDGRLPQLSLGPHSSDRCAPPLLPLAVWYLSYGVSLDFAATVLPQLARAHRWLLDHREPHRDGLLSWGNDDPTTKKGPIRIEGWVGAAYESGLDNSPMWEELGYDESTRSLGRGCVDLCSYAALSARILAALSAATGAMDPRPFEEDYRRICAAVNGRLYGEDGLYHNLKLDGGLASRVTPTSFYPLLAGLVPRDRAAALVERHLRSRESFWGPPVLPSVPRNSPLFDGDGDYWRGRVWPPMNYLVWAGLRQHAPAEAAHLAQHSRELFDAEWNLEGHVHENYSATTSRGEAATGTYARSSPFYCWGGLLLLPDIEGKSGGAMAHLPSIKT
jgi:hypothetical protein